jgi:hypothetical protein
MSPLKMDFKLFNSGLNPFDCSRTSSGSGQIKRPSEKNVTIGRSKNFQMKTVCKKTTKFAVFVKHVNRWFPFRTEYFLVKEATYKSSQISREMVALAGKVLTHFHEDLRSWKVRVQISLRPVHRDIATSTGSDQNRTHNSAYTLTKRLAGWVLVDCQFNPPVQILSIILMVLAHSHASKIVYDTKNELNYRFYS